MMKITLQVVVALAVLTGTTSAADKPNFSGEWKLNLARSDFGPAPPPTAITRRVTHAEPSLTIVEEQTSVLGDQNTTRAYTTDGKEITFQANGAEVKSSATWDGAALVVISKVDVVGLLFNDRMTMSVGGKAMTSVVHITSPQGDVEITLVFDRQ
jgi:hypothetical protein